MAKKERQKRAARQARAQERAEREALQAANAPATDSKKAAPAKAADSKPAKAEKKPGRIKTYFRSVKAEMHRVVWPSHQELKNYTIAVTALLLVFGFCLWLIDSGVVAAMVGFTGLRG